MQIYHNEFDPKCCEVLERQFPDAVVDHRSIENVKAEEIADYPQCHFFAGIGGFSEAFRRAGVGADRNVWTGGFPCQDLSVAGKRAGLAGSRSGLYFTFQNLIAQCRPGIVFAENVPGLLSSNGGKDFALVVGGFTGIVPAVPADGWGSAGFFRGRVYSVAYRIFNAQYFGLAQRRRRVFIVASLGTGSCAEILFEREGMYGNPPARREAGQGTSTDVAPSLEASGRGTSRTGESRGQDPVIAVQHAVVGRDKGGPEAKGWRSDGATWTLDGRGEADVIAFEEWYDKTKDLGGTREEWEMLAFGGGNTRGPIDVATARNVKGDTRLDFDTETFIAFNPQSGGDMRLGVGDKPTALQENQRAAIAFTERTRADGRNVEEQEELAYALTNPGSGGRTHSRQIAGGFGVRRLTPTECERLQGFPDGWTAGQADANRYRQLGNAVAVPVVEWIARRILSHI